MGNFKYYAFISYNHRDERWAAWLQRRLEYYRLPAVARKEVGKRHLRPVFRYVTDLGIGSLNTLLKAELDSAKFLVVVCSPNSAVPNASGKHWVNDEIAHFMSAGGADRIVPVVVDGEVDGGAKECLAPALKEAGIVGVDIRKDGKDMAIHKVVAKLLGLDPDILIQRHRRERSRFWMGLAMAMAAVAAVCGFAVYDFGRTVSVGFQSVNDTPLGLPRGTNALAGAAATNLFHRLEFRGYRLGGKDYAGGERWSPLQHLGFNGIVRRHIVVAGGDSPATNVVEFSYDRQGFPDLITHLEEQGGAGRRNVARRIRVSHLNDVVRGHVVRFADVAEDGSPTNGPAGCSVHELVYDSAWRVVEESFFNRDGKLFKGSTGHSVVLRTYDAKGRVTKVQYFDENRRPVPLSFAKPYCSEPKSFDDAGNLLSIRYLDGDGRPYIINGKYGWDSKFDGQNREIRRDYCCLEGTRPSDNICAWEKMFDLAGRHVETTFFFMEKTEGWAVRKVRRYDEAGHVVSEEFFGEDNRLAPAYPYLGFGDGEKYGAFPCRSEYTWDASGRCIGKRNFGSDRRPLHTVREAAGWNREFDDKGKEVRRVYLGVDGKPATNRYGYAESRASVDLVYREYLGHNFLVKREITSLFDPAGKPADCSRGYSLAVAETSVDSLQEVRECRYNAAGKLVGGYSGERGVASVERYHSPVFGNLVVLEVFKDADDKVCANGNGIAGRVYEYDDEAEASTVATKIALGVPLPGESESTSKYCRTCRYIDGNGRFCNDKFGIAGYRSVRNARNEEEDLVCFDLSGKRVWRTLDGEPVKTKTEQEFGPHGTIVGETRRDEYGNAVPDALGCVGWRRGYDKWGNELWQVSVDENGRAIASDGEGRAGWRKEYSERGDLLGRHDLDVDSAAKFLEK